MTQEKFAEEVAYVLDQMVYEDLSPYAALGRLRMLHLALRDEVPRPCYCEGGDGPCQCS